MAGDLRTLPQAICSVGMTVDGREVTKQHIDEIVETYSFKKYGARINLDHSAEFSGWLAKNYYGMDLSGGMLGDVMEVFQAENDDGVLCLYSILSPNASFVLLNQSGQAVYYSVELDYDFQGSGKTYIKGLAATDYPACCYTTRANFTSNTREKGRIENFRSTLNFSDISALTNIENKPEKEPFSFKSIFTKKDDEMKPEQFTQLQNALTEPLNQLATGFSTLTASMQSIEEKFKAAPVVEGNKEAPEGGEQASFSLKDNEDFKNVESKINEFSNQLTGLSNQLSKALGEEDKGTTNADDFNLGENSQLLDIL